MGWSMSIEWVAQTDALTCANCGKSFNEGDIVVGELDKVYHKQSGACEDYKD